MSLLVIQIPPRDRLNAHTSGAIERAASRADEFLYALSPDGLVLQAHGQAAPALLPKADTVIAVLADIDVGWHRIVLPKAPASRLRAALVGVLEEAVLEDAGATHLALAPQSNGGQLAWVAAVSRPWLAGELAALERAHVFVDRVVPASWPDDPPTGHFAEAGGPDHDAAQGVTLTWSHPDGVATLRLHGGLVRAVIPASASESARWSATPGAAAAAEQWLGMPVNVMQPPQRLLQAARTLWNLRQFDLARRSRGTRALRDAMRQVRSSSWRPVRVGLAALAAAQILGLNLWAWHQRDAIGAKRAAAQSVVMAAFPRISPNDVKRDAASVMQREVDALRAMAGKPGETDLEPMLQAAAIAWPSGQPPAETIRYEPGKLSLAAANWGDAQIEDFRSRLRPAGWQVDSSAPGRVAITRGSATGAAR